jgi:hypothetical protein
VSHAHSSDPAAQRKRQEVRGVACPYCGAERWEKCKGVYGQKRARSHAERWAVYRGEEVTPARTFKQREPRAPQDPAADFEVLD